MPQHSSPLDPFPHGLWDPDDRTKGVSSCLAHLKLYLAVVPYALGCKSACGLAHVFAHFAHCLLRNDDGGTQLLSRHAPVNNFLWLSPCWRSRYSEIVHTEDNKDHEKHARLENPLDKALMFSLWQRADTNSQRSQEPVHLNNVCVRANGVGHTSHRRSTSSTRMMISSVVVSMRLPRRHSRHFRDVSFTATQQAREGGE